MKCNNCGKCCSNYLPLSYDEIKKLRVLAKGRKSNKNFLDKDYYSTCPFLNSSNRCDIYEDRPAICRAYTCEKFVKQDFSGLDFNKKFKLVNLREEIFNEDK